MMNWVKLLENYRRKRILSEFTSLGKGCTFLGDRMEISGIIHLGDQVALGNNLVLDTKKKGRIHIGHRVVVSDYVMMHSNEAITIGDDSYIGPYSILRDNNHVFQGTDAHWRYTPPIIRPIVIKAKCFIGAKCYVMPGVVIDEGAVIMPGSVVTRNVGAYEIWGGSPSAQFVAHRLDESRRSTSIRHNELLRAFTAGIQPVDASDTTTSE